MAEQIFEQSKPFSQRDVLFQRRDDGLAEPALAAELLRFREELLPDGDGRAHVQNLPEADAPVNEKCIAMPRSYISRAGRSAGVSAD
jgi:hypothetical protein